MYHDEYMINGRWFYRNAPNAEWIPMDIIMLSEKYKEAKEELSNLLIFKCKYKDNSK